MSPEKRLYALASLPLHLSEGGEKNRLRLRRLLTTFDFLADKLKLLGPQPLIDDYSLLLENTDDLINAASRDHRVMRLIQDALRLSAHILERDHAQLTEQLAARLMSEESPEIQSLLEQAVEVRQTVWLRLMTPTLLRPGQFMRQTVAGSQGGAAALAVNAEDGCVLSAVGHVIEVWKMQTGQKLRSLPVHEWRITSLGFMPRRKSLVVGALDGSITIRDWETNLKQLTISGGEAVVSLHVTKDEERLVSLSRSGFTVWSTTTGERLLGVEAPHIKSLSLTGDEKYLLAGSVEGRIDIWNLETGQEEHTLGYHGPYKARGTEEADPYMLAAMSTFRVVSDDGGMRKLNLRMPEPEADAVNVLAVTPDGSKIVSGSNDKTLIVWDARTGRELLILAGHRGAITTLAITTDGKRVISGSTDNTLKVWSLETGAELFTLAGHDHPVESVVCARGTDGGQTIVSSASDGTMKIWGLEAESLRGGHVGHDQAVDFICVSQDGRYAYTAAANSNLKVWDLNSFEYVKSIPTPQVIRHLNVTADKRRVISSADGNRFKIWDLETGVELQTLDGNHAQFVNFLGNPKWKVRETEAWQAKAAAISSDGRRALTISSGEMMNMVHEFASEIDVFKVWEMEPGANPQVLIKDATKIFTALTVSPGEEVAACAAKDNTSFSKHSPSDADRSEGLFSILELATGDSLKSISSTAGAIRALAFTPDDKHLIAALDDGTLKTWNFREDEEPRDLSGEVKHGPVRAMSAGDDGYLVSTSDDNILRLWSLADGHLAARFMGDSAFTQCAITHDGATVVAGDANGHVHILRVINAVGDEAPTTEAQPPDYAMTLIWDPTLDHATRLRRAEELVRAGKSAAAASLLQEVGDDPRSHPWVCLDVAMSLEKLGHGADAIKVWCRLALDASGPTPLRLHAAEMLESVGRDGDAARAYRSLALDSTQDASVREEAAERLSRLERVADLVALMRETTGLDVQDARQSTGLKIVRTAGAALAGLGCARELLTLATDSSVHHLARVVAAELLTTRQFNDPNLLVELGRDATLSSELRLMAINALVNIGQTEQAVFLLSRLAEDAKADECVRDRIIGIICKVCGFETVLQAIGSQFTSPSELGITTRELDLNNRAAVASMEGRTAEAVELLTEAIRLNPGFANAYFNRGSLYRKLTKYQQAVEDLTRAIRLDAAYEKAYANRADTYLAMELYELALADFSEAIRLKPDEPSNYNGRAAAYDSLGQGAKASADREQAHRLEWRRGAKDEEVEHASWGQADPHYIRLPARPPYRLISQTLGSLGCADDIARSLFSAVYHEGLTQDLRRDAVDGLKRLGRRAELTALVGDASLKMTDRIYAATALAELDKDE